MPWGWLHLYKVIFIFQTWLGTFCCCCVYRHVNISSHVNPNHSLSLIRNQMVSVTKPNKTSPALSFYYPHEQVYIGVSGKPAASHTDTKGYLMCQYQTSRGADKALVFDDLRWEYIGWPGRISSLHLLWVNYVGWAHWLDKQFHLNATAQWSNHYLCLSSFTILTNSY